MASYVPLPGPVGDSLRGQGNTPGPQGGAAKKAIAPGLYALAAIAALSLSDGILGPVIVAGLTAAVVYNANEILLKKG